MGQYLWKRRVFQLDSQLDSKSLGPPSTSKEKWMQAKYAKDSPRETEGNLCFFRKTFIERTFVSRKDMHMRDIHRKDIHMRDIGILCVLLSSSFNRENLLHKKTLYDHRKQFSRMTTAKNFQAIMMFQAHPFPFDIISSTFLTKCHRQSFSSDWNYILRKSCPLSSVTACVFTRRLLVQSHSKEVLEKRSLVILFSQQKVIWRKTIVFIWIPNLIISESLFRIQDKTTLALVSSNLCLILSVSCCWYFETVFLDLLSWFFFSWFLTPSTFTDSFSHWRVEWKHSWNKKSKCLDSRENRDDKSTWFTCNVLSSSLYKRLSSMNDLHLDSHVTSFCILFFTHSFLPLIHLSHEMKLVFAMDMEDRHLLSYTLRSTKTDKNDCWEKRLDVHFIMVIASQFNRRKDTARNTSKSSWKEGQRFCWEKYEELFTSHGHGKRSVLLSNKLHIAINQHFVTLVSLKEEKVSCREHRTVMDSRQNRGKITEKDTWQKCTEEKASHAKVKQVSCWRSLRDHWSKNSHIECLRSSVFS